MNILGERVSIPLRRSRLLDWLSRAVRNLMAMALGKETSLSPDTLEGEIGSSGWRCGLRRWFGFPLGYVVFGVLGVLSSLIGLALSYLLPVRLGRPLGQGMIRRLFAFFLWYLRRSGIACLDYHGLASPCDFRGAIIVANHPTLLDVIFLIARLPRAVCLMKAGVASNLVLCGTARLAGYVDNRSGKRMVKECADRLRQGETLVIFPEGTRTIESGVNPFKMGFALVAQLAGAPVHTVLIRSNSPFLGKRWPFLQPPASFPLRYTLQLGRRFEPEAGQDPKEFGRTIEHYFRTCLGADPRDTDQNP